MEETTQETGVSLPEAGDEQGLLAGFSDLFDPPKPEEKQEVKAEEPEDLTEEVVEEATQEEIDASDVAEHATDSQDAEDEAMALETLSDLQEYLGVESLDELKVPTKIDGVDGEATWGDVLKSYQLESHVNAKSIAVSEKEKQLEKEFKERTDQVEKKLADIDTLQNMVAHQFLGKWQAFDWDKARAEDPEVNDKWMEYQQDLAKFQTLYQTVEAEKQKQIDEQSTSDQERLVEKAQRLQSFFPDWKGPVIEERSKEINQFLTTLSFNGVSAAFKEDEVYLEDPRFYPIIHMAMEYQKLQKESPKLLKVVKKAPTGIKATRRIVNKKAKAVANLDKRIKNGDEDAFLKLAEGVFTE